MGALPLAASAGNTLSTASHAAFSLFFVVGAILLLLRQDYTGGFRTTFPEDEDGYQQAQEEVFAAVNRLQGTVASLVVLDPSETKKAGKSRSLGRSFHVCRIMHSAVRLNFCA